MNLRLRYDRDMGNTESEHQVEHLTRFTDSVAERPVPKSRAERWRWLRGARGMNEVKVAGLILTVLLIGLLSPPYAVGAAAAPVQAETYTFVGWTPSHWFFSGCIWYCGFIPFSGPFESLNLLMGHVYACGTAMYQNNQTGQYVTNWECIGWFSCCISA